MDSILRGYYVNEPTWFYLSFLLIVAVFFKFSRLWSVRNLDLTLLLLISPGLLIIPNQPAAGYAWLFVVSACLLARVLLDSSFVRRPRFEQNMNAAGLTFLCAAVFAFLMTKVMTDPPAPRTVALIGRANQILHGAKPDGRAPAAKVAAVPVSPDTAVALPADTTNVGIDATVAALPTNDFELMAARSTAILAHLAVIIGLALVGRQIFSDLEGGVAMATLYMLLPCTAFDIGEVNHVLPAALIVWAVWAYRRPLLSGMLLGLACSTLFFPIFLLPLWAAFYGRRGGVRFVVAVGLTAAATIGSLALASGDTQAFVHQTLGHIEWARLQFRDIDGGTGFWRDHEAAYRIPVFVTFLVMLVALTIWPRRKSVTHLMSHSAAVIIGTQFWYTQQGGVYVLWYLPLLLLLVFRPAMTNHFAPELRPFNWLWKHKAEAQPQPQLAATGTDSGSSFR